MSNMCYIYLDLIPVKWDYSNVLYTREKIKSINVGQFIKNISIIFSNEIFFGNKFKVRSKIIVHLCKLSLVWSGSGFVCCSLATIILWFNYS